MKLRQSKDLVLYINLLDDSEFVIFIRCYHKMIWAGRDLESHLVPTPLL